MSPIAPTAAEEFGSDYAREQLRRSRHPVRRLVKRLYLREILRDVNGPTIDFGCGAGQLLACLPAGSIGIEVNPELVRVLRAGGLEVLQARGAPVDFDLADLPSGRFQCLVISHVLEHLDDPAAALAQLMRACRRLGVSRLIAIVPGRKGYASDRTHKTFIDGKWLTANPVGHREGFVRSDPKYFPGPEWVGSYFVFHEMKVVFDSSRHDS